MTRQFAIAVVFLIFCTRLFSQNDTLYSYALDDKNDYFKRIKVAEQLFYNDSTNALLNNLLFFYFELSGKTDLLCKCHRNTDYLNPEIKYSYYYGEVKCHLLNNEETLADSLITVMEMNDDSFYKRALDVYSRYMETHYRYDKALELMQRYYQWKLEIDDYGRRNETRYLHLLEMNRNYDELLFIYDSLLSIHPLNIRWLKEYARICGYVKEYEKSIQTFQKIIELENGENSQTYIAIAQIYYQKADTIEVIESMLKALTIDTNVISTLYKQIRYYDEFDYVYERDSLIEVVLSRPADYYKENYPSDVYKWLFFIQYYWGDRSFKYLNNAIEIVEKHQKEYPYNAAWSTSYSCDGKLSRTIGYGATLLAEYHYLKGWVYEQKYKRRKAIQAYEASLHYDSISFKALLARGNLNLFLKNKKDRNKAKSDFEKILQWDAWDYYSSRAKYGLGRYYYYNQQNNEAIDQFAACIRKDENNAWAYYYLSLIFYKRKEIDKSMEHIKKAIETNPEEETFTFFLKYYIERENKGS